MSTRNKLLTVNDVMLKPGEFPVVEERAILKEALEAMGKSKLGIVSIVNADNYLVGVITDGDIRRKLLKDQKPFSAFFVDDAVEHGIRSPKVVNPESSLVDAVALMGTHQIWDLPVVSGDGELVGLLHLHPAVKALLEMN